MKIQVSMFLAPLVLVPAVLAGLSTPALAEHTIVLPASPPEELRALGTRLDATALAAAKELSPAAAMGGVSLGELALVAGCSVKTKRCRKAILETVQARRVIAIAIERKGEETTIRVQIVIDSGSLTSETVAAGATDEETAKSVRKTIRRVLGAPDEPDPVEPDPVEPDPVEPDPVEPDPVEPDPVEPDPVEPDPVGGDVTDTGVLSPTEPTADPRTDSSFSISKIEPATWAVIGGGGAALVAGAVFLGLASQKQGEIDDAPIATIEDIRRLLDLEDAAQLRSSLGFAFAGVGVAALAVGAVLAVRDGRRSDPLSLTINPGGGGLIVGVGGQL